MARAFDGEAPQPAGDTLHEACGVTGIYAPGLDVARLAYFALYALQHRGQESAGIAVSDGGSIECHREMGLLSSIFDEDILSRLTGYVATGHTRYSTTGSSIVVNAQPLLESTELGEFAISHNGNLTNALTLRQELISSGAICQSTSDTEVILHLLSRSQKRRIVERFVEALRQIIRYRPPSSEGYLNLPPITTAARLMPPCG